MSSTLDTAPADAAPAAAEHAGAEFGHRLARRVAARTGVRRHASGSRSIGIVSRSAVGFGQAIGRSSHTRPDVHAGSLTSLRLRPPAGWWHTLADDTGSEAAGYAWQGPAWTDDLVPRTRHTPRPVVQRTPASKAAQATTATPTPPAAAPAPAPVEPARQPAAAAPTGLGRLDALRHMLAAGVAPDGSRISPEILHQQRPDDDVPADVVAPTRPRAVPARTVPTEAMAAAGPTARQAFTEAGPATGPGALGRRMQPELVEPGTRAVTGEARPSEIAPSRSRQQPTGGSPSAPPGAPSAPFERDVVRRTPATAQARRADTPAASTSRRRPGGSADTRGAAPGGLGPASMNRPSSASEPGAAMAQTGTEPARTQPPAPRADAGFANPIAPTASAAPGRDAPSVHALAAPSGPVAPGVPGLLAGRPDVARDTQPTAPPPSSPPPAMPGAPGVHPNPASRLGTDVSRSDTVGRSLAGDRDAERTAAPPAPAADTRAPLASAPDARATSASDPLLPAASTPSAAAPTPPFPTAPPPTRAATLPLASDSIGTPVALLGEGSRTRVPGSDLRLQRLITSDPNHRPAPPAALPHRSVAADPLTTHGLAGEAAQLATAGTATLLAERPAASPDNARRKVVPRLPSNSLDDDAQPIRRVTLPRAMSRVHRPATRLTAVGTAAPATTISAAALATTAGIDAGSALAAADTAAMTVRPPALAPTEAQATVAAQGLAAPDAPAAANSTPERSTAPVAPSTPAHGPAFERASVRPAAEPAPATSDVAQPGRAAPGGDGQTTAAVGRRRRSVVGTGAEVLRRALADRVQPRRTAPALGEPTLVGPSDAGLPVAPVTALDRAVADRTPLASPAGFAAPDSTTVRRNVVSTAGEPTRTEPARTESRAGKTAGAATPAPAAARDRAADVTRHAAGRQRSDAGAALAERFMTELSQAVRSRPAPLPTTFRPLADQIAPRRSVALSTDAGSRRALRSVGKRAATVGDTIHLDASAQQMVAPSARLTEVIAHELTHVAHASPAPRFFDDIDESPEERRADMVARTISRAPVSPTNSTLAAPFAPARPARPARTASAGTTGHSPAPSVIRRTPTGEPSVSAADLAARLTGTASQPSAPDVIRRRDLSMAETTAPAPNGAIESDDGPSLPERALDNDYARAWFQTELDRNTRLIIERLEDTILAQLERRGGRFRGGF